MTLEAELCACRALHRTHGTTYYWATKALPRIVQPHVHALYGVCRYADEIVDALSDAPIVERAAALDASAATSFSMISQRRREQSPRS